MRFGHQGSGHCAVVAVLALMITTGLHGQPADTEGWTGVSVDNDRQVISAQSLADLSASNARRCLRMCWLFRACSALTFTLGQKRCQLFVLSGSDVGAYRLSVQAGSQSVDMRRAKIDTRMVFPRGCDKRPCSEQELCAPVKHHALHVCIKLASEFCSGDPPTIPYSNMERDNVSSVLYTCAHGYFRTGTNHVSKCNRQSGTWTSVDTTCSLVDCGTPPSVYGASTSTCEGSSSQWSPVPGPCVAVSCGEPPAAQNMEFELADRRLEGAFPGLDASQLARGYGGEARYTCVDGYTKPEGATYISHCQADGSWGSTDNFRCSPVDCGPPPSVTNARPPEFTATTFAETATISCLPGYAPVENITLVCNASARWEGPEMTCEEVDCGEPITVALATIDLTACLPGFSPVQGVTLTCNATGAWEPTEENAECRFIDCGEPTPVNNAGVDYNETGLNARAQYSCTQPAVTEGDDTSSCQENGQWSAVTVSCFPVPCGEAKEVAHSSVQYVHTNSQLKAEYTCDPGYTLQSESGSSVSCLSLQDSQTNSWESKDLTCRGVSCGEAPGVPNANVALTGSAYPYNAVYTCNQGYFLSSPASTKTCQSNAVWSADEVVCTEIKCPPPQLQDSAQFATPIAPQDKFSIGQSVNFQCADTFTMVPKTSAMEAVATSSVTCQDGTSWTSPDPKVVCLPTTCGIPPAIPFTTWSLESGNPHRAAYQCVEGYDLPDVTSSGGTSSHSSLSDQDTRTVECDSSSGWSVTTDMRSLCSPVDCGGIQTPADSPLQEERPTDITRYFVDLDEEACCPNGLRACGVVTYTGDENTMVFGLYDVKGGEENHHYMVLRVTYSANINKLLLEKQRVKGTDKTMSKSIIYQLLEVKQEAEFCIVYDIKNSLYQFQKNGNTLMETVVMSSQFTRFAIKHSVQVSLFTLDYGSR
ncbi:sushi, von Willebrand factor type A, EGF and pentraxin domain-containing protein 1 [Elysia marginata]|uniref:Sushi, von Willebrand factor type A, EGF and pentraxin domain-containing protein 1 n=1 Tax=Elysia marginata TaxID=1093978 RepID=A0AAV4FXB3_9GAST|nr:sushi, von Willebrand factor type A, EGF and pentraxin domain-containing protein 1 [Elysia marginata]